MVLLISANQQTIYIQIQKYNMILKTLLLLLVTISYTDHKIWEEILLPDSCSNQASLVNKLTVLCQNQKFWKQVVKQQILHLLKVRVHLIKFQSPMFSTLYRPPRISDEKQNSDVETEKRINVNWLSLFNHSRKYKMNLWSSMKWQKVRQQQR